MSVRSRAAFRAVKEAVEVEQVARELTELRREGSRLVGRCPLPDHEDRTPSFQIFRRPGKPGYSIDEHAVHYSPCVPQVHLRGQFAGPAVNEVVAKAPHLPKQREFPLGVGYPVFLEGRAKAHLKRGVIHPPDHRLDAF